MKKVLASFLTLSFCLQGFAQTKIYLKAPPVPSYETCPLIKVDNQNGGTYETPDVSCLNRNEVKKTEYSVALESYNRAGRITTAGADTATRPANPVLEECKMIDNGNSQMYSDYACQARNQTKQHDYNVQIDAWNYMQKNQGQLTEEELARKQAAEAALANSKSVTENLQKAISENQRASQKSSAASTITAALSVVAGVKFMMTCASCMGGCCQYGYLAASVGLAVMSAMNSKQASNNDLSGYNACLVQNKIASGTTDCGPAPAEYQIGASSTPKGSALVPSVFNANGDCVASDKSVCSAVVASLPAGTNIKDITKGASAFASPFTLNPDGSATLKGGKILKPSDFKDKNALMAAGYTADQAAAAMASLAKGSVGFPANGLEKAAAELKNGKLNSDFSGSFMSGSGGGSESGKGNAGLGSSGGLDSKNIGGGSTNGARERNPAGEGLTRDFNGEAIGAAGDDIFSMMNRRYKMKTSQDSFISN